MKGCLELEGLLWQVLHDAGIGGLVSGGVYRRGQRPPCSGREDVVVGMLTLATETSPQRGVANVNVYVPDCEVTTVGRGVRVPDNGRLAVLGAAVDAALRGAAVPGVGIVPEGESVLADGGTGEHYVNVRVSVSVYV